MRNPVRSPRWRTFRHRIPGKQIKEDEVGHTDSGRLRVMSGSVPAVLCDDRSGTVHLRRLHAAELAVLPLADGPILVRNLVLEADRAHDRIEGVVLDVLGHRLPIERACAFNGLAENLHRNIGVGRSPAVSFLTGDFLVGLEVLLNLR